MKIVHFIPRLRLAEGGVVRAVIDLCDGLASRGVAVTLVTHDPTDAPGAWGTAGAVAVLPTARRSGPATLLSPAPTQVVRAIAEADVLHLHTPWEPLNPMLARAAARAGVPYIVSLHGMLDDWSMSQRAVKKRLYLQLRGGALLRRAAAIHCTADDELRQASRWFPERLGAVIPYVQDLSPFRRLPGPDLAERMLGLERDTPVVLFFSRLHIKKGLEIFIEAVATMLAKGRRFVPVIAGSGDVAYTESLHSMCRAAGVDKAVRFVGHVGGDERLSLLQRASVMLLPTSQENFGLALTESIVAGTPVVTTRGVDIWRELERSGGAVVVDRTVAAFVESTEALLDDPERLARMGDAGRSWVLEHLDGARTIDRFIDQYRRVARPGVVE